VVVTGTGLMVAAALVGLGSVVPAAAVLRRAPVEPVAVAP
jgi:hypothetical protein